MSLLKITDLSHTYMDKVLYKNAAFDLYKGEHIGVVGQNGTGKSTLIRILTGDVVPDTGLVKWQSGLVIGHLDQYAALTDDVTIEDYLKTAFQKQFNMERDMNRYYDEYAATGEERCLKNAADLQEQLIAGDFYMIDSNINKAMIGLGLDAMGADKNLSELSGGQRTKVILAKLLLEEPDVLLLDEPTNFLDAEHVDWLSGYLAGFKGAFIVVSHDFDFLEAISGGICHIEFGTIRKYHGTYTDFLKQKEHLREDYLRRYYAQKTEIEKTEAFIRKNIAGNNSRIAKGRRKQLEHVERLEAPQFAEKPNIHFKEIPLSAQLPLSVKQLEVGYERPLLLPLDFWVGQGEKLVITGFNGIGKSTLLKTLMGLLSPLSGKYQYADSVKTGYFEQDLQWKLGRMTPLQIVSGWYPSLTTREIRRVLAQCGVKEANVGQEIRTLSGGEQSKVKLCRLALSPCNFLILDEPTNHLDAETKEVLKQALKNFEGSMILVSHEESFYQGLADRCYQIENWLQK